MLSSVLSELTLLGISVVFVNGRNEKRELSKVTSDFFCLAEQLKKAEIIVIKNILIFILCQISFCLDALPITQLYPLHYQA